MKPAPLVLIAGLWPLYAQSSLSVLLPERTRLLEDQQLDLVIEARNMTNLSGLRVTANAVDITARFKGPAAADLDCDGRQDAVYRADLFRFSATGPVRLSASVSSAEGLFSDVKDIIIQPFSLAKRPRNIILMIGDAMGNAYRDAGRIIARSVETVPGLPGFREGFFDRLLEMDQMPVSGMVMGYGKDRVIADSSAAATNWAIGNKTIDRALSAWGDGNDCLWGSSPTAANLWAASDNPRVETLWEYMKRKYNYRTGVVATSNVTDATPAAHGSHNGSRDPSFELTSQFLENPFLNGQPVFDVILGGGKEDFDPDIRRDGRDMIAEFQSRGYTFVQTATDVKGVNAEAGKLLGLFRQPNTVTRHASDVRPSARGNMDPAYDKLRLTRPGSEPVPNFGIWTDQPFLDLMARKAIEVLSGPRGDQPFVLMIEGSLIDKQAHSAHVAGTLWDVIEFDKAVGVARAWAKARPAPDTLIIVTADHDQTMTIIGVADVTDADLYDRIPVFTGSISPPVGNMTIRSFKDANTNVRPDHPWASAGGGSGPPANRYADIYGTDGFPDYQDTDGDGYPENRQVGDKGRLRLAVGFRTGSHAGTSLPLTAEGPGAFLFTGYMDQTDLFYKMATVLTGETAEADALLKTMLENPRYPRTFGK